MKTKTCARCKNSLDGSSKRHCEKHRVRINAYTQGWRDRNKARKLAARQAVLGKV